MLPPVNLGKVIPTALINPVSANVMALFPQPTSPGISRNFAVPRERIHDIYKFDIKVDHTLSQKAQFFVRYSLTQASLDRNSPLGIIGDSGGGAFESDTRFQNAVISDVHTFSPTTVNEFRIGFNRYRVILNTAAGAAGANLASDAGIPGINGFCQICVGFPRFNITGIDLFGNAFFRPTFQWDTMWDIVDNVTLIRGKHTLKFGGEWMPIDANLFQARNVVGEFRFNSRLSSGAPDAAGNRPGGSGDAASNAG